MVKKTWPAKQARVALGPRLRPRAMWKRCKIATIKALKPLTVNCRKLVMSFLDPLASVPEDTRSVKKVYDRKKKTATGLCEAWSDPEFLLENETKFEVLEVNHHGWGTPALWSDVEEEMEPISVAQLKYSAKYSSLH